MIALTMGAWLAATWAAPVPINPDALAGVAGPLASASVSWLVVYRTHRSDPERVTGVMVIGFALKALFFAVYLVLMIRAFGLGSMTFVVSFIGSFILLLIVEAMSLKRLFAPPGAAIRP